MTDKLWTGGKIEAGHYIQPKLYLVPETVTSKTDDGDREHIQLHRRWKGSGRFKSGTYYAPGGKVATTEAGLPITMLVDIRVGKSPKAETGATTKSDC